MSNPFNLELFDASKHEGSSFECGEPSLDDYLKKYAKQDIKRDFTRMRVIVKNDDPDKLIYGYSLGYSEFSEAFLQSMNSLNQKAKDFYLKHGFKELNTSAMILILPISTIPSE